MQVSGKLVYVDWFQLNASRSKASKRVLNCNQQQYKGQTIHSNIAHKGDHGTRVDCMKKCRRSHTNCPPWKYPRFVARRFLNIGFPLKRQRCPSVLFSNIQSASRSSFWLPYNKRDTEPQKNGKRPLHFLGVASPFFSTIVLFKQQQLSLGFRRFSTKGSWGEGGRYP